MLTEEEKELIDMCSEWGEEHRDLIRIISRLVKENEELQNFNEIKAGLSCAILQQEGYCELQTQLDAIKKAWEPVKDSFTKHKEITKKYVRFQYQDEDRPIPVLKTGIEALDKLIGGK